MASTRARALPRRASGVSALLLGFGRPESQHDHRLLRLSGAQCPAIPANSHLNIGPGVIETRIPTRYL